MTREEAIQHIAGLHYEEDFPYTDTIADFVKERNEAIDMAIEALSEETSTIQEKHQFSEETSTLDTCPYYHHEPTGEPFCEKDDRRHGEWLELNDPDATLENYYVCNQCGRMSNYNSNYCPNCGAKMDGERREE